MNEENPHAGGGPVVVDIGGDIGALVVVMPEETVDLEVEIVPTGTAADHQYSHDHGHPHDHGHGHEHGHEHGAHPPHVAVVRRPLPSGALVPSLVFGSLAEGTYDLYVRPDGPVQLTAVVRGGEVTEERWPGA